MFAHFVERTENFQIEFPFLLLGGMAGKAILLEKRANLLLENGRVLGVGGKEISPGQDG
jgi:hypothetical protein